MKPLWIALLLALSAAASAQPADSGLQAHAADDGRAQRLTVFEATVDLFEDYYWDPDRLDWEAWADRHRDAAVSADVRSRFDSVMRRMIQEVGDDHSRWLGLTGLDPALTPLTPPFQPVDDPAGDDEEPAADANATAGLGMVVVWVPGVGIVVERVLPGTPAEEAGVMRGDVIRSVAGTSMDDVGAAGVGLMLSASLERQSVELTFERGGRQTYSVVLEPRYLIQSELRRTASASIVGDGVGYLYIPSFTLLGTGERAHRLLTGLLEQGTESLVLDLRGNGGGSLAELGVLMGAFVDGEWARASARGEVVWRASFDRGNGSATGEAVLRAEDGRVYRSAAVERPVDFDGPLVVLVDEGTSSAAEVAAAVLQASGRAKVVGVDTDGNVEVVRTYLLPDRSQVMVAVANLELPTGDALDGGIAPDAEAHVDLRELARGYDAPVSEGLRLLASLPFSPGRWF